jgi:hypothetical protein
MFSHLNLSWLFGWRMLTLMGLGALSLVAAGVGLLWWVISHLQWVW